MCNLLGGQRGTPGKLQQLSTGAAEEFALSKIQLHSQDTKGRMSALKEQFLQQRETFSLVKWNEMQRNTLGGRIFFRLKLLKIYSQEGLLRRGEA